MYTPIPENLTVSASDIHGLGLFATEDLKKDLVLGVTHVANEYFEDGWIRTPLGGFYNHSETPNCYKEVSPCGTIMVLVTLRPISAGEELTVHYTLYSVGEPAHDEPEE